MASSTVARSRAATAALGIWGRRRDWRNRAAPGGRGATTGPIVYRWGTRILRGRGIERGDVASARRVMVIGAPMGAVLWPGQDLLGKWVRIEVDTMPCTYVVGVAEDIHPRASDLGPATSITICPRRRSGRRRVGCSCARSALVLAAGELYSVIAYNVAQRRQELAVRVTLGAAAADVMRLVVAEGLR